MRALPRLTVVLLAAGLLAGCGSDPAPGDQAGTTTEQSVPPAMEQRESPAAGGALPVTAPDIDGLEVLAEDPSHEHRDGAIEYDRTPPLGGPHNPRWLACDVYDEPVPAEFAVHSIEHGAVWISYDPELPADQIAQLETLAKADREYVLLAPRAGLDSRIVAVTWGMGLEASSADDPRLAEFVAKLAGGGQGGEPGAPCRGSGLTLREANGLLATAS